MAKITQEQLQALREYAEANGRTWKSKLNHEWMTATASWPLMQIRNQFGPSWLVRFNLRKEVEAAVESRQEETFRCDQCEALMINGTFCHETGCPNEKKTWVPERDAWVRFVECFECGYEVEAGESCDCQEPVEDEDEDEDQADDQEGEEDEEDRILLSRSADGWLAQWVGPHAAGVIAAMGTDTVPCAFTAQAPADMVLAEIQALNPDAHVEVA